MKLLQLQAEFIKKKRKKVKILSIDKNLNLEDIPLVC